MKYLLISTLFLAVSAQAQVGMPSAGGVGAAGVGGAAVGSPAAPIANPSYAPNTGTGSPGTFNSPSTVGPATTPAGSSLGSNTASDTSIGNTTPQPTTINGTATGSMNPSNQAAPTQRYNSTNGQYNNNQMAPLNNPSAPAGTRQSQQAQ